MNAITGQFRTGAAARRTVSNPLGLPPAVPEQARWPELDEVFAAIPALAWGVAAGLLTDRVVQAALLNAPVVQAAWRRRHPDVPFRRGFNTLRAHLTWTLQDEIRAADRSRAMTAEAVAKAVAPLLDRGAPDAELQAEALAADPDAMLTPAERQALVDRERAWWTRLHAALLLKEARVA